MIHSATEYLKRLQGRPVCVVGKGPTFDRYAGRPQNCLLVGLNQAAVECKADVAVVTDADVVTNEFLSGLSGTCRLVMPCYPHVGFKPRISFSLDVFVSRSLPLAHLMRKERLLMYRSDRARGDWPAPRGPRWPIVRCRKFSAAAALNLLFVCGFRAVMTAGIDGGTEYHPTFAHLTPLTNGQGSFSAQDGEIDRLRDAGMVIHKL